jgi:hypothetical protein
MRRERLTPVEFYEREVLPRLSVETVYPNVRFTARRGRYWRGPCPLHGGKDPNFSVDTFFTLRVRIGVGFSQWRHRAAGS